MNPKPNTRRKQPAAPVASAIQATLTFELPAAEEFLELAVQSRKWRQLVRDFSQTLSAWGTTHSDPQRREFYREVHGFLREYLTNAGLGITEPEWLEECRERSKKEYFQALDKILMDQQVAEAVEKAKRENEVN
jgi:hypothetical protein